MNIGDITIGFLLGAAVGPAAGFYVGVVTGFVAVKAIARALKGKDDE